MHIIDVIIIAVFAVVLMVIAMVTNRRTTSVAGFLSSERLAGRYLLTCRKPFNLDRLLHRGKYKVESDEIEESTIRSRISKALAVTNEFSRADKVVYFAAYAWMMLWALIFIVGTLWNITHEVSTEAWARWWKSQLTLEIVFSSAAMIWFSIGGARDVSRLFRDLRKVDVNKLDDGRVSGHHQMADEALGIELDEEE